MEGSRLATPTYIWRGRQMRWAEPSAKDSFHCASQPTVRPMAKMVVKALRGMPIAESTMPAQMRKVLLARRQGRAQRCAQGWRMWAEV